MTRIAAFGLALMFLAGCGSGGGGSLPGGPVILPTSQPTAAPTSAPKGKSTSVVFTIPALHKSSSALRRPSYLTLSIQSVTVAVTSENGKAVSGTGTSVTDAVDMSKCPCTVSAPNVPPGSDTFDIKSFDKNNAVVSEDLGETLTIKAGTANSESVTLLGLPASFSIGTLPSASAGTAFSAAKSITLTAKDVDGNTISGKYENAVTVQDSDTSDLTNGSSLLVGTGKAASSVSVTQDSDALKLMYGGLAIPSATITASATGATSATASFAPTLQQIVFTAGPLAISSPTPEVDLYTTSGTGSSGSFSVTEAGYTNSPYNKSFTKSVPAGCSGIATVTQSATTFTEAVAASPAQGSCTISLSDGLHASSFDVILTYTGPVGIGVH